MSPSQWERARRARPVAAGSRSRGFGKQRGLQGRTRRSVRPTPRELRAEPPGRRVAQCHTPVSGRAGTPLAAPVSRPTAAPQLVSPLQREMMQWGQAALLCRWPNGVRLGGGVTGTAPSLTPSRTGLAGDGRKGPGRTSPPAPWTPAAWGQATSLRGKAPVKLSPGQRAASAGTRQRPYCLFSVVAKPTCPHMANGLPDMAPPDGPFPLGCSWFFGLHDQRGLWPQPAAHLVQESPTTIGRELPPDLKEGPSKAHGSR